MRRCLRGSQDHPNAGLTQINILAELYITQGLYNDGLFLLDKAKGQMCNGGPLPADLAVRAGICHAYLGNKGACRHASRARVRFRVVRFRAVPGIRSSNNSLSRSTFR